MSDLEKLQSLIFKELENFVVEDTYTKGKNAGLRKALALIADLQGVGLNDGIYCTKTLP